MGTLRLRRGSEADQAALQALLAANQMETDIHPAEFLVAESDGALVGAARLEWEQRAAYLRPVVVEAGWHHKGVGRALVLGLARGLPALSVISRGQATGFYGRLGFLPMAWEQVPERYQQECAGCPDRKECQPVPMRLDRTGTGREFNQPDKP